MLILTSVGAYQWPYTLYVFRRAAGRAITQPMDESTNKGRKHIVSGDVYLFESCITPFGFRDKHYTNSVIKNILCTIDLITFYLAKKTNKYIFAEFQ